MKKEKSEKVPLLRRLGNMVREESGNFFGDPLIEWRGRGRLTVGGAQKIGSFSAERILVLLAKEKLIVCGRGLVCLSFQNETLVIGGKIHSVTYGEEDE